MEAFGLFHSHYCNCNVTFVCLFDFFSVIVMLEILKIVDEITSKLYFLI